MAIAVDDLVTPHRVSTEFSRGYQGQPPTFGICDVVAGGNRSVVWGDGRLQAGIAEAALDEVLAPLSSTLLGKVVEISLDPSGTLSPSASFDATVVAMYRRDLSGAGSITEDLILCKLLNADVYIETVAANASVLDDR